MRGVNVLERLKRLLIGLALVGALLPVYGPSVDHHFYERLPGHAHVYGTAAVDEHVHPYQTPHTHRYGDLGGGVFSLPSGDEGGGLTTNVFFTLAVLPLAAAVVVFLSLAMRVVDQRGHLPSGWGPILDPPPPRLAPRLA